MKKLIVIMMLTVVAICSVSAESVDEAYSLHPTAYSIFCLHEQIEQEPNFSGKWLERIGIDVENHKIYLKFYDEDKEDIFNLTNIKTGIAGTKFYYTPQCTIGIDTKDGRVSLKKDGVWTIFVMDIDKTGESTKKFNQK